REALPAFAEDIFLAWEYLDTAPASSLTKSRIVMEKALLQLYKQEMAREPRKPLLGDILADNQFTKKVDRRLLSRMNSIRDMGNLGPHGETVEPTDAARVLDDLCVVLDWYVQRDRLPSSDSNGGQTPDAPVAGKLPGRRQKRISLNAFVKSMGCSITILFTLMVAVI